MKRAARSPKVNVPNNPLRPVWAEHGEGQSVPHSRRLPVRQFGQKFLAFLAFLALTLPRPACQGRFHARPAFELRAGTEPGSGFRVPGLLGWGDMDANFTNCREWKLGGKNGNGPPRVRMRSSCAPSRVKPSQADPVKKTSSLRDRSVGFSELRTDKSVRQSLRRGRIGGGCQVQSARGQPSVKRGEIQSGAVRLSQG